MWCIVQHIVYTAHIVFMIYRLSLIVIYCTIYFVHQLSFPFKLFFLNLNVLLCFLYVSHLTKIDSEVNEYYDRIFGENYSGNQKQLYDE